MRAEVTPSEDTTMLYLRWEIIPEGPESKQLARMTGPLSLRLPATNYVDLSGTHHERIDVDVPIFPHNGKRNFGQAKFTDFESRRSFWERLQKAVTDDVANFVYDVEPETMSVEGVVIEASA